MQSKLILDDRFRVFENGDINKIVNGIEQPAKIYYTGKTREYFYIAIWNGKKTVHKYLHRLIAEAFVPNPHGYKHVTFKDNNTKNVDSQNLEWASQKKIRSKAAKLNGINQYSRGRKCSICGKRISNQTILDYCEDCYEKRLQAEKKQEKCVKRAKKLPAAENKELSEQDEEILKMWLAGKKYKEIATAIGFSRSTTYYHVKRILNSDSEEVEQNG